MNVVVKHSDFKVDFIPLGGMCRTCAYLSFTTSCAILPFKDMPVSKTYNDGTVAVVCTKCQRENA